MTASSQHHALDYVELVVTDLDVAKRFFTTAFGWSFRDYGPGYAGILSPRGDGSEVGGLLLADAPRPVGGPLVLLYSDDLDATSAAIQDAGGRILQEPYAFPGGRRLHFADPSGNELGVWSSY
ncbi:VOC family protein [Microbacterium sp. BLY]|uniref:VOC family protein n=1 Tax=Microbacterium sp. BLY TaxID=2823280 RepID=UPI001B325FA7|nr:VOC family protein [Microbacterium sp. BLY]MBP3978402.1 VOC family protein [Microbacterium sp. BLY]